MAKALIAAGTHPPVVHFATLEQDVDSLTPNLPSAEAIKVLDRILANIDTATAHTRSEIFAVLNPQTNAANQAAPVPRNVNVFTKDMERIQNLVMRAARAVKGIRDTQVVQHSVLQDWDMVYLNRMEKDGALTHRIPEFENARLHTKEIDSANYEELEKKSIALQQKLEQAYIIDDLPREQREAKRTEAEEWRETFRGSLAKGLARFGCKKEDIPSLVFLAEEYIIFEVAEVRGDIEQKLQPYEFKDKILHAWDDYHRNPSENPHIQVLRKWGAAEKFAYAVTATDALHPQEGQPALPRMNWMDTLKDFRSSTISVRTNAGTYAYLYVDKDGKAEVLHAGFPDSYTEKATEMGIEGDPLKKLQAEQSTEELRIMHASLVSAHVYAEPEIIRAFDALPRGGKSIVKFSLFINKKVVDGFSLSRDLEGNLVLHKPGSLNGKPSQEDFLKNPGKYLRPTTLVFESSSPSVNGQPTGKSAN